MNAALRMTTDGLISALSSRPLARQTVHKSKTVFSKGRTIFTVLVIPEGQECGEYYEVFTKAALDDLRFHTPEEMGLDPLGPDEVEDGVGIPSDAELLREYHGRVL